MANDDWSHGGRGDAAEAHTVPGGGGGFGPHDRETSLPTCDLDSSDDLEDERDAALMRAVAYAPPRRPPSTVVPGTKWSESGRYIIDRRLGRGGMGTVYAATDTVLNRIVALKVLDVAGADHDPAHHARLLREAQLAASMEHERIARVYDVGSHEGFAFVAMEYVPGGTLRQWMARGNVPLAEIVDIVTQIAEGLAELHAKGVVHRDLKPENVMMTAQGGVKLVDFGLARHAVLHAAEADAPVPSTRSRLVHSSSTAASSGTPGYMAPEQCNGLAMDERVDIFALGVILYELIAHEKPFRGATVGAIVDATLEGTLIFHESVWAGVPARLRQHTARMLERDPDARFANGGSVLAALRELATGLSDRIQIMPKAARVIQAIAGAPTQRAVRSRVPVFAEAGLAPRGVELSVAAVALLCLALQAGQPPARKRPTPPAGMALIEGGSVSVGQNKEDVERECRDIGPGCRATALDREVPRQTVSVTPFFLDREEVTNAELAKMLNLHRGTLNVYDDDQTGVPRFVRQNRGTGDELLVDLDAALGGIEYVNRYEFRVRPGHAQLPAVQMTWYAARLYCATSGKRLPTENEWEAAARGVANRRFPWGDAPPRCGQVATPDDGWIPGAESCSRERVAQPVGTMSQDVTPEGIHDLAGNVSEWTSSLFVQGNRTTPANAGSPDAPRVFRGGSWNASLMARTSGRDRLPPSIMGPNLGFRCAVDLEAAQP